MNIFKIFKNANVVLSILLTLFILIYIYIAINNSPEYFSNKGLNSYRSGNFNKALVYYNKALKLNPDIFETYYNIGCVYFKLGDKEKSKNFFKQTLELNKNYQPAINNLRIIEKN